MFVTDFGVVPSHDPGFGRQIAFDTPLLDGYSYEFLATGFRTAPGPNFVPVAPLFRAMRRSAYDAVLVHGYRSLASWFAAGFARVRGTPYLLRGDSQLLTELNHPAVRQHFKRQLLGPFLRGASCCLAIGSSNADFYKHFGVPEDRIVVAPFSVDSEHFTSAGALGHERRAELLRSIGLEDRPTVVFSGKLISRKRVGDLLAACEQLRIEVNLLIIGDGEERNMLEHQAVNQPRTRFLGFVNQGEIGQWYGVADLIVLPAENEPWGLVINEAMAAGCVAIVSDTVGCGKDLVAPGGGRVYRTGDIAALTSMIEELLGNSRVLKKARISAGSTIAQFSLQETVDGFEHGVEVAIKHGLKGRMRPKPKGTPPLDH